MADQEFFVNPSSFNSSLKLIKEGQVSCELSVVSGFLTFQTSKNFTNPLPIADSRLPGSREPFHVSRFTFHDCKRQVHITEEAIITIFSLLNRNSPRCSWI
jgi:hypothetical protein